MTNKLTIDDLIKDEDVEIYDYDMNDKLSIKQNNIENINQFISQKLIDIDKKPEKADFYTMAPKTKLEHAINKAMSRSNESYLRKRQRLAYQENFDMKMRRMKRIKSKSYRKIKRMQKREEEVEHSEDINPQDTVEESDAESQEQICDGLEEDAPIFAFAGNINEEQHEIVKLAFDDKSDDAVKDFVEEKKEVINDEAPKQLEIVLPGWGEWAGPGLEVKKTKYNTIIETKDGITISHRKDAGASHVIITESQPKCEDKYKTKVPYGYSNKDYLAKLDMSISKECNTSRMYKQILKAVTQSKRQNAVDKFVYNPEN